MQTSIKLEEDPIPKVKEIVKSIFPEYNYSIIVKGGVYLAAISFEGSKKRIDLDYNQPSEDPYNEFHRTPSIDFVVLIDKQKRIGIEALWREANIRYELDAQANPMWTYDSKKIAKPFPHGDEFENLALQLYEIRANLLKAYIKPA